MPLALSQKELICKFRALGYSGPFSGRKNKFMVKGSQKIRIPNPHTGDISASLIKEMLRQTKIPSQEWDSI